MRFHKHSKRIRPRLHAVLGAIVGTTAICVGALSAGASQPSGSYDPRVVVEFVGTDVGEIRSVDGIDMLCFDGDLVDMRTGRVVGTGTDCLDLASIEEGDPFAGDAFVMTNVTYFDLPQGTIQTTGRVTISPVMQGTIGEQETAVTHVTGNFSRGEVLSGTGAFADLEADVRLQGAVDMSAFDGGPGSPISFNCIFVFDLAL